MQEGVPQMGSKVVPQGWICVDVLETNEQWAKDMRADRDRQFGNIYREEDTDVRWVGDLGEKAFDSWLRKERLTRAC